MVYTFKPSLQETEAGLEFKSSLFSIGSSGAVRDT